MSAVKKQKAIITLLSAIWIAAFAQFAAAQEVPSDYQQVMKIVGKQGDYKANVLKVNIPRNDLHVKIAGDSVPTPFGFGGWFAMTKGDGGEDVVMGDLVLTQEEVNPVMSALLDHGLEVTALRGRREGPRECCARRHWVTFHCAGIRCLGNFGRGAAGSAVSCL